MPHIFKLSAALASAFLLSACDPAFKTTAQKCAEGQELEILISVVDPKYQVLANDPNNDYELYLRKALETMVPDTPLVDADEIAAKAFVDSKIESFLDYSFDAINTNEVSDATNPVDFLENIIASTDPLIEVESFTRAKALTAQAVADGDDSCSFVNSNIRLVDGNSVDLDDIGYGEFSLRYDPFTEIVQQSIIFTEVASDLDSSESRATIPYAGFFQAQAKNFKAEGFTSPDVRQLIANNDLKYEQLSFDEGTDTELGQIILDYNNDYCDVEPTETTDADGNTSLVYDDCTAGVPTRAPSTEVGGVCDNEANKYSDYSFDLSPSHTNLKRLRVEVDYTTTKYGEVRIYGSQYREAIYAADGTTEIHDPTPCEKQAVLDQLFDALPEEEKETGGVRLTSVSDANYDITYQDLDMDGEDDLDSDGNRIEIEPTPLYTYQGTTP